MRPFACPAIPGHPLTLRALERADAEAWFEFASDPKVMQHTSSTVRVLEDLLPLIERGESPEPGTPIHFAVCLQPEGRLIGFAGFHTVSVPNRTAEITYSLHPQHWGKGFASAVCSALAGWGFSALGFVRIQATVLEPNVASLKVLQRCGFVFEGKLRNFRLVRGEPRDYLMYSLVPHAIRFVEACVHDAQALADIRVAAMRESLERVGRFDAVRARERFLSGFDPRCTRAIELQGERVGFYVLKPQADALLLDHLYVLPAHQGRGVGAAVLAQVFAQANAQHLPVRVGALRGSDSNRFYARHGFVLVEQGEFDNYYVRQAPFETPIAELPNLGPKSAQALAAAGITSVQALRRMGAVAAYAQAKRAGARVSLNLLWALEGGLSGLPWQEVAREHRTSLLIALEEHEKRLNR